MREFKQLDIYIDESGNFANFSKDNPLFVISFVMVEDSFDNHTPITKYKNNLENLVGGEHFVHVGNLIRGEKPYENMLREERWKLFYALYLFASFAKYNVLSPSIIKSESDEVYTSIAKSLIDMIDEHILYFKKFDSIILHYDFGQGSLAGIITTVFLTKLNNCRIIKTTQNQTPFLQLADLFAYFELLKYKVIRGYLTKSETKFFGGLKNLKVNYLKNFNDKYL